MGKKICLILLFSVGFTVCSEKQKLIINTDNRLAARGEKAFAEFYFSVIKTAFSNTGVEVALKLHPSKRALINVSRGIDDGNFLRISTVTQAYTNLIIVPEAITHFHFTAFSRKGGKINNLNTKKTAFINGWKIYEDLFQDHTNTLSVRNSLILFELLKKKRIDFALHILSEGCLITYNLGYENIIPITPPIAVKNMFLVLNKKHKTLIQKTAEAIRTLKTNGTYKRLKKKYGINLPLTVAQCSQ